MEILKQTPKITLATLKSFAKRNKERLFVKETSSFDGMTDCVKQTEEARWVESKLIEDTHYYKTGIDGVYTVGGSRDYLKLYEDSEYIGIEIYNCCGNSILAIKKESSSEIISKEYISSDFDSELLKDLSELQKKCPRKPTEIFGALCSVTKQRDELLAFVKSLKVITYSWKNYSPDTIGYQKAKQLEELLERIG